MIDGLGSFGYLVAALLIGIPTLGGLLLIVGAVVRWRRARLLAETGQRVTAVITDNQQVSYGESGIRFKPVVRFRTLDGREVKTVLDGVSSNRSHLTETPIDIWYDPIDPRRAAAKGQPIGRPAVGTILLGLFFLAFAAAVMFSGPFH